MYQPIPTPSASRFTPRLFWFLFILIAGLGALLRIADSGTWRRTGPDELMYRRYVMMMDGYEGVVGVFPSDRYAAETQSGALLPFTTKIENTGAAAMPELVDFYLTTQASEKTLCELPPTRFLYIYLSWLWKRVQFGDAPPLPTSELSKTGKGADRSKDADRRDPGLASLHRVACLFVTLLMLAGGLAAWRMFGCGPALGILALMACDPLQIHMSQHAMVDGFFAFWAVMAVWTTWECMRAPESRAWLTAHILVLALMVMTKENSFFVYCALGAAVVANRWLKFGTVTPRFILASILGGLLGVATLVTLAGGPANFIEVYHVLVKKAQGLAYAQLTGDGPWYRYLIDLMTISPIVLCLALGSLFVIAPRDRAFAYLVVFVVGSYLIMCNVRYGMNLRYASIWELPLRAGAVLMVLHLTARFGLRQWLAATALITGLSVYELRQYSIFAGNEERPLYEMIPSELLRHIRVIKG